MFKPLQLTRVQMSKRCSNTIGKVSTGLPGDVPGDVLQQAATFCLHVYLGANCLCVGLFRYASRAWKSGILRYMPARSDRRRSQEQLGVYGNRDNGSFPVCIVTWTFFWYRCVCSILLPITAGIWKYTINFLCAQKKERNAFVLSYSSKIWLIFWMSFCL